jgi:alcohol dehydrogenase
VKFEPFNFVHSNRRVVFGWGALDRLADLAREFAAKRAAVVLDEFFMRSPVRARIDELLRDATGYGTAFHAVPVMEPNVNTIHACFATLQANTVDFIVALGGGSAMDTAKIARMMLSNPGGLGSIAGIGKKMLPHASTLVAVPTTAGTGSEVSESAIAGKDELDVKLIFRSPEMTPQIALLDPALSVSAPAHVTAASGYDAITHAVEAYVSKMASIMTDPYALSAMELLATWLPVAYRDPEHREARAACLIGSMQAAIAFNSANLGLAHAISAPLGAQRHVAHGLGNALALPYVTAYNEPELGRKGEAIARIFGAPSAAAGMARMRRAVGLDVSLDEYVKTDEERESIAQSAMKSGQVRMNPRLATIEHMRAILEAMRTPTGEAAPVVRV